MPRTEPPPPSPPSKLSTVSLSCRICYDGDKDEALIAPCSCKGSLAFIHRSCLQKWLLESNTIHCELCHEIYQTEPGENHRSCQWFSTFRKGFRSDVILCTAITPAAIILTYFCLFSSDYYNKDSVIVPATRWAVLLLLLMIAIMLIAYYIWVYSVIRLHSRMWFNWGRRDVVVRYVASGESQDGENGRSGEEVAIDVLENDETEDSENKNVNV